MPDENVFEFLIELSLEETLSACLAIAEHHDPWRVLEDTVTDTSFQFEVPPHTNPLNSDDRPPYLYLISLFPSAEDTTRVQFTGDYQDRLSGSAILEYNYLRSQLLTYHRSQTPSDQKRSQSLQSADGLVADLMISAPLFQSNYATRKALKAIVGDEHVTSRSSRSHYEIYEFDLPGLSAVGTALVRGLDRHSRVTVEVSPGHVQDPSVHTLVKRFIANLDTRVEIERVYTIDSDKPEDTPIADPVLDGTHIFISYRRDDTSDVSGRIYDRLMRHYDREQLFKDVDTIPLGADFRKVIDDAVSQCRVVLAVIGRDWISVTNAQGMRRLDDPTDFVRLELEFALDHQIPVIPVLVRGAEMPPESDLPESLRPLIYRQAIQVRSDPDFHTDMDRLVRGIEYLFGRDS